MKDIRLIENLKNTINSLDKGEMSEASDLVLLLKNYREPEIFGFARDLGREKALENYGNNVFIRDL